MEPVRPWATLSPKEQERVGHIYAALKEFSYGCHRMEEVVEEAKQASAMYRFYMNALYSYLAKFFLVSGHNLTTALRSLGVGDLAEPVETVLNTPLGSTNLRTVLSVYRNKFLAHPQFSFDPVEKAVYDKFDLNMEENQKLYEAAMNEAMQETIYLYLRFVERFPGMLDPE